MLKPDTSRLDYIQKVSGRNGAQTRYLSTRLDYIQKVKLHIESQREERCSNQIPLDSTTYRKSNYRKSNYIQNVSRRNGAQTKIPLDSDYIQKFKLSWEEQCSNQIPLDSTTYRKSNYIQKVSRRNGAQTKIPLDSDYIQKVKFKLSWEEQCSNQERCSNQDTSRL